MRSLTVFVFVLAVGCDGTPPPPARDATVRVDAGPDFDAGDVDAGGGGIDAGPSGVDAGPEAIDAGFDADCATVPLIPDPGDIWKACPGGMSNCRAGYTCLTLSDLQACQVVCTTDCDCPDTYLCGPFCDGSGCTDICQPGPDTPPGG